MSGGCWSSTKVGDNERGGTRWEEVEWVGERQNEKVRGHRKVVWGGGG